MSRASTVSFEANCRRHCHIVQSRVFHPDFDSKVGPAFHEYSTLSSSLHRALDMSRLYVLPLPRCWPDPIRAISTLASLSTSTRPSLLLCSFLTSSTLPQPLKFCSTLTVIVCRHSGRLRINVLFVNSFARIHFIFTNK